MVEIREGILAGRDELGAFFQGLSNTVEQAHSYKQHINLFNKFDFLGRYWYKLAYMVESVETVSMVDPEVLQGIQLTSDCYFGLWIEILSAANEKGVDEVACGLVGMEERMAKYGEFTRTRYGRAIKRKIKSAFDESVPIDLPTYVSMTRHVINERLGKIALQEELSPSQLKSIHLGVGLAQDQWKFFAERSSHVQTHVMIPIARVARGIYPS